MKEIVVPIDKAGRVVLPKSMRDQLAIGPGDMFKISIHGNEIVLHLEKDTAGFVRKGRALVFSSGGGDLLDREAVEAVLAKEREESIPGVAARLLRKSAGNER